MPNKKINIEIPYEVNRKAWEIKEKLQDNGKKYNVEKIYARMLTIGAISIQADDLLKEVS